MEKINLNPSKFVYLLLHNHNDLVDTVISRLVENNLNKRQIVNEDPRIFANIGDYVAEIWEIDEPTKIILRQITETKTIPPQREGDGESNWITFLDPPLMELDLYID